MARRMLLLIVIPTRSWSGSFLLQSLPDDKLEPVRLAGNDFHIGGSGDPRNDRTGRVLHQTPEFDDCLKVGSRHPGKLLDPSPDDEINPRGNKNYLLALRHTGGGDANPGQRLL